MNVLLRWPSGLRAVCLGVISVTIGLSSPLAAQTVPNNPLRAPQVPPVVEPTHVQPAAAAEPIRLAIHSQASAAAPVVAERPALGRAAAQPAAFSYGSRAARPVPGRFVPRHELVVPSQAVEELTVEPMPSELPGPMTDMTMEPTVMPDMSLSGDCCDTPACGDCAVTDCGGCGTCTGCLIPCPIFAFDNLELFAGTQAFTGPLNLGETASFGFHYGLNWAAPVPCMPNQPLGVQIGYRGVSSNYSGASFSEDSRDQSFITAGVFRRVDWGLQGGAVVDILSDKWYYDDLSLTQVRGELSWVFPQCHELGAFFTAGTKTSVLASTTWINGQQTTLIEEYEPTDLVGFFYRRRFEAVGGGYGRAFGGFTGEGGGLIGADFNLPLTASWALKTNVTYLIPKDGNNRVAYLDEAWNVGLTLVWYPGRRKAVGNDYFRPLLDVADNGTFIPRPVAE